MAGTVTVTITNVPSAQFPEFASRKGVKTARGSKIVTWACVGDSSNGTVPDTSTDAGMAANGNTITEEITGMFLHKALNIPISGNPTANAGIAFKRVYSGLTAANAPDLLGGLGADLIQNTVARECPASINGNVAYQPVDGAITLVVSDQAVASAQWQVKGFFVEF